MQRQLVAADALAGTRRVDERGGKVVALRLLFVQRKLTSSGPVKTHRGRPSTKPTRSTPTGRRSWALLDDGEADAEEEPGERIAEGAPADFDPDAGWRDRGPLTWERKLAGANAVSDRGVEEHDAQSSPGPRGDDEADDGGADFDCFWSGAFAAITKSIEEDEVERGPRTCDDDSPGGERDA